METTRDLAATTIIVHKGRALLHKHKKFGIWLPVGGHVDNNELPHEAALREIKEETGLSVRLYNPDPQTEFNDARQLVRPVHILLEDIEEGHQHIDFIFYATSDTLELNPQDGESSDLRWFTTEELQKENIPDNVRFHSLEALKLLGN